MKIGICMWFLACGLAEAFSGSTIAPVVVSVVDSKGNPIEGAVIKITGSRLEKLPQQELDPKSSFAELARKAMQAGVTDALGHALCYCGGGFIPDGKKGEISGLQGTVEVSANGFVSTKVHFERSVSSKPEGITELTLKVNVTLETAETPDGNLPKSDKSR